MTSRSRPQSPNSCKHSGVRLRALALLACLHLPAFTMAQTPPPAVNTDSTALADEALQPKFVWIEFLLNLAFKYAMDAFTKYLEERLSTEITPANMAKLLFNASQTAVVSLGQTSNFGSKSVGAPESTVSGEAAKPIQRDGTVANYQAVHVALMRFDKANQPIGFAPISSGFHTGDRFKLKLLPTFDGVLVIENINPGGQRDQIFPPRAGDVVRLKAGVEVLIPLAKDEFFEFAGDVGEEQLIFTLRDPRAFDAAASSEPVNRKEDRYGSRFVQELRPGTYPVIAQSLKMSHSK